MASTGVASAGTGRHAAELLRSLIQSPGNSVARTLLAPELVVRETARVAPIG